MWEDGAASLFGTRRAVSLWSLKWSPLTQQSNPSKPSALFSIRHLWLARAHKAQG